MEYDYEIKYKPGKINKNADALSRPIHNFSNNSKLNFNEFQIYHQKTVDITEPDFEISPISKISNLVIPLACDLNDHNIGLN